MFSFISSIIELLWKKWKILRTVVIVQESIVSWDWVGDSLLFYFVDFWRSCGFYLINCSGYSNKKVCTILTKGDTNHLTKEEVPCKTDIQALNYEDLNSVSKLQKSHGGLCFKREFYVIQVLGIISSPPFLFNSLVLIAFKFFFFFYFVY